MKKYLIASQLFFVIVFSAAFMASFFVVDTIQKNSRELITDKVVDKVSSKIAITEELLNSKAASKYLANYQRETINEEINRFKTDPYRYVEAITQQQQSTAFNPALQTPKSLNPLKSVLLDKIYGWKQTLKQHFNSTFQGLINEIRIFIASNIIALALAALVCYKHTHLGKDAVIVSSMLTAVIALSALSYLDQNWFYSILLNSYSGYGYIIGIFITTGWLYFEYFKHQKMEN